MKTVSGPATKVIRTQQRENAGIPMQRRGEVLVCEGGNVVLRLRESSVGSLAERQANPNGVKARRFKEVTEGFFGK